MGDLLLLTPALRALKTTIPSAKITLLLLHRRSYSNNRKSAEIYKTEYTGTSQVFMNNPDIDEIFELNRNAIKNLKGFQRFKAELRCIKFIKQGKFDTIVCTFPQSRLILWAFFAGVKMRIGQKQQSLSRLLTHKPDIKAAGNGVLKYYCDLLSPLNVVCNDYSTRYIVSEEETKLAQKKLEEVKIFPGEKFVVIHPGASEPHKILPPQNFAKICKDIGLNKSAKIVMISNDYDSKITDKISEIAGMHIPCLKLGSIRELGAVMSLSSLCIVNNSGPRHLAAALGCFNISFFQKYDNGEWSIYDNRKNIIIESESDCKYCSQMRCRSIIPEGKEFGSECMHSINIDKVIEKIYDILQKKS